MEVLTGARWTVGSGSELAERTADGWLTGRRGVVHAWFQHGASVAERQRGGDGTRAEETRARAKRKKRKAVVYMGEGQPDVTGRGRNGGEVGRGRRRGEAAEAAGPGRVEGRRRRYGQAAVGPTAVTRREARVGCWASPRADQLSARERGEWACPKGRKKREKEKGFPGLFNCLCSILFS